MEIQKVKIDRLIPNTWNPNHIKQKIYKKLKSFIENNGSVLPLVARPHPTKRSCFEIIDGYHRWKIFRELGHKEVEINIVKVTDEGAKIMTVNLNYMRGQAKPKEYAELVHELNEKYTLDDLSLVLPDSKPQLLDRLDLLKLPSDMQESIETKSSEDEKESLDTIRFQVTAVEKEIIETALKSSDKKKKGTALADLVKAGFQVKESSLKT